MTYDPERHHRRSIRLKGYDYSQAGAYFVTICAQDRACLFGDVIDGEMQLNEAGRMVETVWDELPHSYPGADIDGFVVMPNHVHGIIIVGAAPRGRPAPGVGAVSVHGQHVGAAPRGRPGSGQPQGGQPQGGQHVGAAPRGRPGSGQPQSGQPQGVAPTLSLPDVVHRFKTMTTKRYADGVHQWGWMPFPRRLWQRNYYEHIIRDEASLNCIRQYIADNPARWALDRDNPQASATQSEDAWLA